MPIASRFERLPANGEDVLTVTINGQPYAAGFGWTIAATLVAHGFVTCRCNAAGQPRGPFCFSGICFECLVEIDGKPNQQACLTRVSPGMQVIFQTEPGVEP